MSADEGFVCLCVCFGVAVESLSVPGGWSEGGTVGGV